MMTEARLHTRVMGSRGTFRFDAEFEVGRGEVVALVGPSGAGKSTCMSAIAGLIELESGRVSLGGDVWCDTSLGIDRPPHERRVGFVHQDYALFPHLSVLQNVLYGARARGASRAVARTRGSEWLERLDMVRFSDRPVTELSGGQRQRIALARALASGAGALLLDEPFGSLDVRTRSSVRRELGEFLREIQLPTVLVTHDPTDALVLANRIAILEDGRITQDGECDDLVAHPRTPFVAELFGLNFYRGWISGGPGLREVRVESVEFHVPSQAADGAIAIAFPPSAVTLFPHKPEGSARNTFQGIVRDISPLPERLRVVLDCGVLIAADVVREAASSLHIERGQTMWISIKATAIQVYS
jgi:molybdate transport system ATP-binding protein